LGLKKRFSIQINTPFGASLPKSLNNFLKENVVDPRVAQRFNDAEKIRVSGQCRGWEAFFDRNGSVVYISQGLHQMCGCDLKFSKSGTICFKKLFYKHDIEKIEKYFERAKSGKGFSDVVLRILDKQESIKYISLSSRPVKNDSGKFVGFRLSAKDITSQKRAEDKHHFLNSLTQQVSDAIIVTDDKFKIIFVNKATENLYGYTKEELIGKDPVFLNSEFLAADIEEDILKTVSSGKAWEGKHSNRKKDGSIFICEFKISPIKNFKGEVYSYCSIQRDVTAREEVRKAMEMQRDLGTYLSSVHNLKDALDYVLDTALRIEKMDCGGVYLVDQKTKALDLIVHRGLKSSFVKKISHIPAGSPRANLAEKRKSVYGNYSKIIKDTDLSRRKENIKGIAIVPVLYEKKVIALLNLASHTEDQIPARSRDAIEAIASRIGGVIARLRIEAEFQRNAYHDSLTNIPNRRLFIKNLTQAIRRAKRNHKYRFAVLFLDLDRFKDINDGMGHLTGDRVILEVSRKLQKCIRGNDTLSRFGGDEFTVLLDDIGGIDDAIDAANRIQIVLSQPLVLDDREFFITGSIGVLMYSLKYHSPEDMLRDADTAMFKAKLSGRARFAIFDENMHTSAVRHIQLENDLRKAVERKEFKIEYQPIVSLKTGEIETVEALLRWNHPEKGMISPIEFIPMAEETGLIIPITEWLFDKVAQQARAWLDQGFKVRFAVNLSALHLSQTGLPDMIEKSLNTYQISPDSVELEITATAAMKEFDLAMTTLHRLKSIGSHVSIDDFGVGYSPLVYLKRFPITKIKIDMSFIKDIPKDINVMSIVEAIIGMAHILKIAVVAEGVETSEQLRFLKDQKCDQIQGFLFSRPVPPSKITEFFKENRKLICIS